MDVGAARALIEMASLLTCGECRNLFSDPVRCQCAHNFCRDCMADALRRRSECPSCAFPTPPGSVAKNTQLASTVVAFREFLRDLSIPPADVVALAVPRYQLSSSPRQQLHGVQVASTHPKRARTDLGMIKNDEVYYQVIDDKSQSIKHFKTSN